MNQSIDRDLVLDRGRVLKNNEPKWLRTGRIRSRARHPRAAIHVITTVIPYARTAGPSGPPAGAMAAPLAALRAAFAQGPAPCSFPQDTGQLGLVGLDLYDGPAWYWRRPRPPLPACPQAPWPWFAPAWLELPLPAAVPLDGWWYHSREDVGGAPECWFLPVWRPHQGPHTGHDPTAVMLLWDEAQPQPGLPCRHRVQCPWA